MHSPESRPARARYDLIVIGGGATGTGIFRDAAMRGLRCALVEKDDFGAGTTGASSGMIHGGARYLASQPKVTKLSCLEAGRVRRIAPHLLFRIPFVFPVPAARRRARMMLLGMDGFFEAYDRYQPLKAGMRHRRLSAAETLAIEPGLSPDIVGAVTFDEWGIDSHRLCWLNARAGIEAGGDCFTHTRIDRLEPADRDGSAWEVGGGSTLDGGRWAATARCVVNAAGPWGPAVAALGGGGYRLRPAKGIHLVLDRRIVNFSIAATAPDGRTIFLEPWQNVTLLGTTDDDYYGDLDDIPVTQDEVQYLLQAMETVYPRIRSCRLVTTWAGVRPTLFEYGRYEDDLSRTHKVFDHGVSDERPGLFSVAGGKLASYRAMAEDATDAVLRFLGRTAPCRTADAPLPGGDGAGRPADAPPPPGLAPHTLRRLEYRHGSLVGEVLAPAADRPSLLRPICRCEPAIEAEVRHAVRREMAVTLDDVMRRTRLGTGPCCGVRCALPAATIVASEMGRDAAWAREEARRFLEGRYRARRPVVDGDGYRMEAIVHRAAMDVLRTR